MLDFRRLLFVVLVAVLPVVTGGCKVISIEEDQARRQKESQAADPGKLVETQWGEKMLPAIESSAVTVPDLVAGLAAGIDAAGKAHGRQASEGSPWTFALRGSGTVTAVDRASQRGKMTLSIPSPAGAQPLELQIGPFVSGTAIRDALPLIAFNDFKDQLAYADVGNALSARSLRDNGAVLAAAKPGDKVEFLAVANVQAPGAAIVATPVRLRVVP